MSPPPSNCQPRDISLKALFLGPQGENAPWFLWSCRRVIRHWLDWRTKCFPQDGLAITPSDQSDPSFVERQARMSEALDSLLGKLEVESPKFTPRYLGHMTSEIALPALLGHLAVLLHNPNQTSKEVSLAGSEIEKEAIAGLLEMLGFSPAAGHGHFTSGGTIANLEGAWHFTHRLDRTLALELLLKAELPASAPASGPLVCRGWDWFDHNMKALDLAPARLENYSLLRHGPFRFAELYRKITGESYLPPLILAPASRHYSWPKAAALLGYGTEALRKIPLDSRGRMSLAALAEEFSRARTEGRAIGMVVTVAGSTELAAVDPIDGVQDFLDEHRAATGNEVWHHVDAAYGGYFCSLVRGPASALLTPEQERSLRAIGRAHSATLDPHKLGFVPYACGAFLARDSAHYRTARFGAPYLLADNDSPWIHTIEGSRAGTGAAATWMANRAFNLDVTGYGRILERGLIAKEILVRNLAAMAECISVVGDAPLNIVCLSLAKKGDTLRSANARTIAAFEYFRRSPDFSVSKTSLSLPEHYALVRATLAAKDITLDADSLICLRVVLMNPFLVSKETSTNFIREFQSLLARLLEEMPGPMSEKR